MAALMSMKVARPCLVAGTRASRCLSVAPKIIPRKLHVRCQAQEPENAQKGGGLEKRPNQEGAIRRRDEFAAPELSFRRMSDYIDNLQREMESMFDVFGMPSLFRRSPLSVASAFDMPLAAPMTTGTFDMEEDEKEYRILADVPGFNKENINVTLSNDGVLSIEGHEKVESTEEKGGRTRRVRDFIRRFKLPDNVNAEGIAAKVDNGVLSLAIPKIERPEAAPRQIPIK